MSFLTAEWQKLVFLNYKINSQLLMPYLPAGTKLDLWNGDCYVSLVGMMFDNTKLLGIRVPFHVKFEEVNLRFYVNRIENGIIKKGVVFIKEIVPKPALTYVAKLVYDEKYETLPMSHSWLLEEDVYTITYNWKKKDTWNTMQVTAESKMHKITRHSDAEFIIERYWGYAKVDDTKSYEYEVKHPRWEIYAINQYECKVDFKTLYGEKFDFLSQANPDSVMLVEGSPVSIEKR
ncbi:hypothetical protein LCGC14_2426990, partial [marine sediment metagenome]